MKHKPFFVITRHQQSRYTITDEDSSLRIVIPSRRFWWFIPIGTIALIIFLLYGLILCVLIAWFGGTAFYQILASGTAATPWNGLFAAAGLFFILIGWAFIAGRMIEAFVWGIIGQEVIVVTGSQLIYMQQAGRRTRKKIFSGARIQGMRVFKPWEDEIPFSLILKGLIWQKGKILFEYGRFLHSFGLDLKDKEAQEILAAIGERFPKLVNLSV